MRTFYLAAGYGLAAVVVFTAAGLLAVVAVVVVPGVLLGAWWFDGLVKRVRAVRAWGRRI